MAGKHRTDVVRPHGIGATAAVIEEDCRKEPGACWLPQEAREMEGTARHHNALRRDWRRRLARCILRERRQQDSDDDEAENPNWVESSHAQKTTVRRRPLCRRATTGVSMNRPCAPDAGLLYTTT